MDDNKLEILRNYLKKVTSASKEATKKEAFKDLLNRLYSGEKEIEKIIDSITAGSEATVLNIPREDRLHRGSADTLYNKIIIEFEKDLKVTLKHAKEQLAGYLLGQFNSGEGYNFTLIASDCITWKVFSPDVYQLDLLESLHESELKLNEVESASFTLTEKNLEEFYYWIDRFLFKEQKQRATLRRIEESFGYQSNVFIESYRELLKTFEGSKNMSEIQVSFEQWKKFLSIAYGSFDASESNFIIHTYLSIFSKILAYAVISNDDYIDDDELKGIINGKIFDKYNIQNFVDNDFFHWIGNSSNFNALRKVFRVIGQEISSYDFENVDEDILKGVYQELIDLDTRHALGEYYTPDWLCERIVEEYEFKVNDKILDPACGSGSFLRAAIHRTKQLHPNISVEQLNSNIYGIDIHPLSVQIAKTTMLVALGKEVTSAKIPIHFNIILANTLLAPDGIQNLFGGEFAMSIDKDKILLNTQVFEDVNLFDEALEVCEDLATQTANSEKVSQLTFENNLKRSYKKGGINAAIVESFYKIYLSFKIAKESGRDSIWKFIVQNLYKPYFLNKRFNYVIGNPPWFTFSSIKNEEYQSQLNELAEKYDVKPVSVKNYPNLEIASIFMSYCSSYFLKESGKLAFVLPRSFFNSDSHDNTRSGKSKGYNLTEIWDLEKVSPLFRIPSCVLFSDKSDGKSAKKMQMPGKSFSGRLPAHNCNLKTASKKLSETDNEWFYVKQGKSSAFSTNQIKKQTKVNWYKKRFKRGAELSPRAFYFAQLEQDIPADWNDRILNFKTSNDIQTDAKKPWKGLSVSGKIESNFIFRTALSKTILPFAFNKPDLILLPISIETNSEGHKEIKIFSAEQLLNEGFREAAKWFHSAEDYWSELSTEKNKKITALEYINWNNKLKSQNLNTEYIVLYNASAKDANSAVLKRSDLDLEFIVDTVTYAYYTNSAEEAYYLTSIFNSETPNLMMKDFQSRGLFGARHVHKKILDIFYPKYDAKNVTHRRLAELGLISHNLVKQTLLEYDSASKIPALGKLRLELKKIIKDELLEIDELVKKIIS